MRTLEDLTTLHDLDPGYRCEDGIVVESEDTKPTRRRYTGIARSYNQTKIERAAEEAAWAARSGPVYTIREGKNKA